MCPDASRSHCGSPSPRRSRGFALALTLALVAIAGLVLVGVAHRSMLEALHARDGVESLQRRWAIRSLRHTLLPRAEKILSADGEPTSDGETAPSDGRSTGANRVAHGGTGPGIERPTRRLDCRLAGIDYRLVITDEQAKMNVNTLVARHGRGGAQSRITELLRSGHRPPATGGKLVLHTWPVTGPSSSGPGRQWQEMGAYDQVFERAAPKDLLGGDGADGLAERLTCWGDGRVNLARAPDAVVEATLEGTLPPRVVHAFLSARGDAVEQTPDLRKIIADAGIEDPPRLDSLVAESSRAHGLWTIARTDQRAWYSLAVEAATGPDGGHMMRRFTFSW